MKLNFRAAPTAALLLVLVFAGAVDAARHSRALRLENKLGYKLNPAWELRGSVQARLRDSYSEFYYRKLDIGARCRLGDRVNIPFGVRFEDRRRDGWLRSTYLIFDPTVIVATPGDWRIDVRTRLQYLTDETSLQYLRIQPRLWRSFEMGNHRLGWWVWNDFYFRLVDVGLGGVTNELANNFCSGFNLPLNRYADLNLYYMLFTGRSTVVDERYHSHQACFSLGWHFGGNGSANPPVVN